MMRNGVQERSNRLKSWNDKDQSYEGEFLGDSLHGQGTYRWNKTDVYEGGFFSNQKEGYAVLSFPNNSSFEGLFIKNRAFGPGILTHSNGRQDAGFWVGQKLVRLSRPVDFIVPRLAPTSAAKIKLLQFRRLITLNEENNSSASYILEKCGCLPIHQCLPYSNLIYDPRSILFNHIAFEKTFFIEVNNLFENLFEGRYPNKSEDFIESNALEYVNKKWWERNSESGANTNCLCPEIFVMEYRNNEGSFDICSESKTSTNNQLGLLAHYTKYVTFKDDESRGKAEIDFGEDGEEEDEKTSSLMQIVSWNRSELCTEMLKQIFRHRTFEEKLNFKIAKLMLGARTEFRRTGEKEKECLQFLKMCSLGPAHVVKDLLCHYEFSEELMDSRGNNSLMFAASADQHEIIDVLLDYGVDVNAFNDEGLTPLNLCLLRRLAQTHKICNWETAFLPTEIQRVTENNFKTEMWNHEESIESLDRIFGDGMSADSKAGISQLLEPEGDTNEMQEERDTNTSDSSHQTTMMKAEFVPKSIRRNEFEQSVRISAHDRYLFDLSFEPQPEEVDKIKDASRSRNTKIPREVDNIEEEEEEGEYERKEVGLTLIEKLRQIDKTIEILLRRGADPNISEVPKPSIHLGVFTKDINVVKTLLHYGADPDCQMYPNEGLLTPLHVVALLKSAPENIEICRILLNHGANLEEETSPDFCIYEAEKEFLDNLQGRTPLQILCMRPDLECADPKGYVTQVGLMLAKYSDKRHFYKGHSFLTLAMLTGNIKLLTAFLKSNYYDPNESLGNDLGTALHVLVSTQFQKKTIYENSIKVCDLLLSAKADPLREYKIPSKLTGTCVDYGYREIYEEKATRKVTGFDKKETKRGKQETGIVRDHLKDHIKVVEYLEKKASDLRKASIPTESYLEKSKIQRRSDGFPKLGNGERRRNQNGKQKVKKESDFTVFNENENPEKSRRQTEYENLHQNDNMVKSKIENEPKDFEQSRKQKRKDEYKRFDGIVNSGGPRKGNPKNSSTEFKNSNQSGNVEIYTKQRKENERKRALGQNGHLGKLKRGDESNNFDQSGRNRRENEQNAFNENGYIGKPKRKNENKSFDETEPKSFNPKGNSRNSQKQKKIKIDDQIIRQIRENEQKSFDETTTSGEQRQEPEFKNFYRKGNLRNSNRENKFKRYNQNGEQRRENEPKTFKETRNSERSRQETESKNFDPKGNPRNWQKENKHESIYENSSLGTRKRENEPKNLDSEGNSKDSKRQNEYKSFNQNGNSWKSRRQDVYNNPKENGKLSMGSEKKSFKQTKNLRNPTRKSKSNIYDKKGSSGSPIQDKKSKGFVKRQKENKPESETRENQDDGRNFDSQLGNALAIKKGYIGRNVKKTFDRQDGRQHTKPRLDKQTNKNSKSEIFRVVKRESSLEGRKRMLRVFKSFSLSKYSSFRERFPEKLRQSILQVFGNCVTIDVNQFLLPYVVLRNGDLYYMFEGRGPHKTEQYSLI